MGKFIRKNKLRKRVPWEIAVALTFNILILGAFLTQKNSAPQVVAQSEITVNISNFSPSKIENMGVPETLATGGAAHEPVPVNPEKLTENAMRDYSLQIPGGVSATDKTATERFSELVRTAQGIAVFDGASNIRSGLPSGTLPAGLEVGASFAGRGDAANRSRLLRRHGGNVQTESAVEKALKYLASVQNRNGSWGSKESFATGDAAALSSLALLAFFSHGENFQSKQYGDHIRRGCDFLVELSNTQNIEYAGNGFGHAILIYALAEGYAVSGSLSLRHALEARLKFIISRQNSFGSFALNYDNTPMAPPTADQLEDPLFKEIVVGEPGCDLSLLGWHIQALTAAHNAGVRPDGLDKALSLATEALVKIHQADKGGFSQGINLKRFGANDDMTPVGLLSLQLLNSGNSSPARRAEKILREITPPGWNGLCGSARAAGVPSFCTISTPSPPISCVKRFNFCAMKSKSTTPATRPTPICTGSTAIPPRPEGTSTKRRYCPTASAARFTRATTIRIWEPCATASTFIAAGSTAPGAGAKTTAPWSGNCKLAAATSTSADIRRLRRRSPLNCGRPTPPA